MCSVLQRNTVNFCVNFWGQPRWVYGLPFKIKRRLLISLSQHRIYRVDTGSELHSPAYYTATKNSIFFPPQATSSWTEVSSPAAVPDNINHHRYSKDTQPVQTCSCYREGSSDPVTWKFIPSPGSGEGMSGQSQQMYQRRPSVWCRLLRSPRL